MPRSRTILAAAFGLALALALATTARADELDAVKKAGVLRWGCDEQGGAPYVYRDPHALDSYVGFEAELAEAIAKSLGVKAERVQNQWDKLVAGLQRGDYDVAMNGLEITSARQAEVLFSKAYFVSTLEVAFRRGEPQAATLASMRGKTVGCLKESFAERLLHDAGGIEVKGYEGVIEPYIDLRHHHLDAVVMDAPIALYYGRGPELDSTPADFGEARYGIAAKPGQKLLIEAIDGAIDELAKSGELARICERYGVWNQPTAELFGLKYEAATGEAPMLAEFNRKANGWHDRLANYRDSLPLFAVGAVMTLALSIVGMAIAILLGLALALTRLYAPAPLRTLAVIYIEGIRGTPLLIQLYIIFYALPDLLHVDLPAFFAAVIGLGLNYAAYEAENYRAGLTSIALGQTEAAHALGLTHMQTLRYVIVPQALRIVIPPVTNDFIALLKDSSIVSVIAMTELTETYTSLSSSTGDRVGMGLVAAAFYFVLGWPFAKLAAKLEERARRGRR